MVNFCNAVRNFGGIPPKYLKHIGGFTMNDVKVDYELLKFDPKLDFNHKYVDLPLDSEILSVEQRGNTPALCINYMAPEESFLIDTSKSFHFIICKCEFIKDVLDKFRFVANVIVNKERFAIFYN